MQSLAFNDGFSIAPQYSRRYPARYSAHALFHLEQLRTAAVVYRPRFAALPDAQNVQLPARQSYAGQVWVEPESIVWGIRAYSEKTEGLRVQCTDAGTQERWFQSPVRIDPSSADAIPNQTFLLIEPRIVLEPGLINVELQNLSADPNTVQVAFLYAEPDKNRPRDPQLSHAANLVRALRNQNVLQSGNTGYGGSSSTAAAAFVDPPYLVMPPNGVPIREPGNIVTPAAGSTAVVVSFQIPNGYSCSIRSLSCEYTGPGFIEGSGDLIFRVTVDGAHQRGYDSIKTTLGSASAPYEIQGAIRASAGQTVQILVEHVAGSALATTGTQCIATCAGWLYPQG